MYIKEKKIDLSIIQTPTNFAKGKGVDRKYIYRLIEEDVIDYLMIDGVTFVYLNEKAKQYRKTR